MKKSIDTLIEDIYDLFRKREDIPVEQAEEFGKSLGKTIAERLSERRHPRLRLSSMGQPCERKLWYSIKKPEAAEGMEPWVYIKFLLGDIFEATLLFLAKAAGHDVRGEQDELVLHGVTGHRDGIIDDVLVDLKSASPYGFEKFKSGLTPDADSFGYLSQLDTYLHASEDVPTGEGAFLVGNKVTGRLALDRHRKSETDYAAIVARKRELLASDEPPPRGYDDVPIGAFGNRKLAVVCSYCEFKRTCWPNLRTFIYSDGPEFLTVVKKEPRVPEV